MLISICSPNLSNPGIGGDRAGVTVMRRVGFWTGQWIKPGLNRLKPDKTGHNLREAINHRNGCETIEDEIFCQTFGQNCTKPDNIWSKFILDIIILNKIIILSE